MSVLRLTYCLPLLLLLAAVPARAQQFTGKIAGRVVEQGSDEPLPGVNVLVEGTSLGTATSPDGRYNILRVPAGEYTLVFSFIGFKTVRVEEVVVNVDHTTEVDVALDEQTFQGEEVVVTAERPVVVKDRTSTATTYEARDVEAAPVEGLRDLLGLTAGVEKTASGDFSIRGGAPTDVSFLVNGVEQVTSNTGVPGYSFAFGKANNSWKYDFNPLAMEQMQVLTGGFSAEYGNAQSGVVKLVTKEGSRAFEGEYRMEYRAPGKYHFGPYLYGTQTIEWQRWGELEDWHRAREEGLLGFLDDTSDENLQRLHALWVANHVPVYTPQETVYGEDGETVLYEPGERVENKLGVYDYRDLPYTRFLFGLGGPLGGDGDLLRFHLSGELRNRPTRIPTVEQVQRYGNVTLTTTFQPSPRHKFKLTNTYQHYRGGLTSGAEDIRWAGRPASWKYTLETDSPREETTTTQNLSWTFTVDDKSYLEAMLAHSFEQYRVLNRPVTTRVDPWYINPGPWDMSFRQVFSLTTFYLQDTRTHFYDASVNYTRQVTSSYMLRGGLQFRRWDTQNNGVSSRLANVFVSGSGYGEYYEAHPTYAAAYVQNKLEFEGMVANAGLRLDGYNFNMDVPADRFDPFYPGELAQARGNPDTENSKTFVGLSPRLGLSFPIGERTAFRLQYGHFYNMPQFRHALMRSTELGWKAYGNPNLGLQKTVAYEVGLQQALGQAHRLDVVTYYNDRVSQVGLRKIVAPTASIRDQDGAYVSYASNAYSASYGIETTLEYRGGGPWHYRLSYTLSRSTYGTYGPSTLYSDDPDDPRNFQARHQATETLGSGDRTHRVRSLVTYRTPQQSGPALFGWHLFGGASVGLIYTAHSGTPYIYSTDPDEYQRLLQASEPNRRYPIEEQFDLNVTKALDLGGYDAMLGVRVTNLFGHRWLTPMASRDVLSRWAEYSVTRDEPAPFEALELDETQRYDYFHAYRNVPREVYFTLGVRF